MTPWDESLEAMFYRAPQLRISLTLALGVSALGVSASGLPVLRAQDRPSRALQAIHQAAKPLKLSTPRPHQAGLVVTASGMLVAGFRQTPAQYPKQGDAADVRITLWSSNDGGATWPQQIELPGGVPSHGFALAADPVEERVHVAWSAAEPGDAVGVWYGQVDPSRGVWHEEPHEVVTNVKPGAPFLTEDLAVGADGTVALAVTAYRSPPQPWVSWQGAVLLRAPGSDSFDEPRRLNVGGTGISINLAVHDGVVHSTYRTHGAKSNFGVHYRRFDIAAGDWLDDTDLPVFAADDSIETTNASSLYVTDRGEVYVLYPRARKRDHGDNGLRIAWLAPGADPTDRDAWTRHTVFADRSLRGGNENPLNFTLSRGPGALVHAVFSLKADQHTTLHQQTFAEGRPVGPPRQLAQSNLADAFATVSGVTDPRARGLLLGTVAGQRQAAAVAAKWPLPRRFLGRR